MTPEIRALLVCPRCKGDLVDERDGEALTGLRCDRDGLRYPVVDGVPWLVEARAKKVR